MSRSESRTELIPGLIEDLDIARIKPPQAPLRSKLTGIEQLARSIKENGLLQPVVARPIDIHSFEIVAGNRRFNACKSLGWRKIPCHIVELDDKDAFEISLVENVQRKTLNPIEEAEAFKKYVSDFGWGGVSDVARKIGRSTSYVTKRIKLLNLPKDVLEDIMNSAISKSIAEEMCSLEGPEQSKLAKLISERHLSLRVVRSLIRENDDLDAEISGSNNAASVEKYRRVFDKTIIVLRIAMSKLGVIIDNTEDKWMVYEILMQQKNMLHSQVDFLIKQKKKLLKTMLVRSAISY